ncbi:hypothetical protein EJV47_13840 [Hymenobacter gummosus]|uniref:Uncharacterized protein n=1 Tax=Hymenobacter gummosus TaxID=1776032 RepID=A0A431U1X7_9BACT|nr:hypothetical protein [Hymenobacter gummosus]RTQ49223.1 hypothetical protein EJV47_13840 [Hymenobacter gummosus]
MSELPDDFAAADVLPPGFYEKVGPFLSFCGMGCLQFFSRPNDPLPQEITELTGLDLAGSRMITAINSNETLARQLLEEPELFYVHLLVGCLVLEGPLAAPVLRFLQQNMQLDAEQTAALQEHLLPFGTTFMELVGKFAAQDNEDAQEELHLLRLQIEGAFARLTDTLQVVDLPPAPDEAAAADDEEEADESEDEEDDYEDEDDEPIFQVGFIKAQLQMLHVSVMLVRTMPSLSELPFAQAVGRLSSKEPDKLDATLALLEVASEETPTQLSWNNVAVLYQSSQVLAMALVSNVLDTLHWELYVQNRAEGLEVPENLAENLARSQEIICLMISGFVKCIQENFAEEPRLEELQQEVTALADLL